MIKVELKDHTALQPTTVGAVEIAFNQYRVFVNGNLAGYIGKGKGQGIKLIAIGLPLQIKQEIQRQVEQLLGHSVPKMCEPARIPDETKDSDEDAGFFDDEF